VFVAVGVKEFEIVLVVVVVEVGAEALVAESVGGCTIVSVHCESKVVVSVGGQSGRDRV